MYNTTMKTLLIVILAFGLAGIGYGVYRGSITHFTNKPRSMNTTYEATSSDGLVLTSPAFSEGERVPPKYTCDGEGINPPLDVSGVDENAKSLVLTLEDPDAPMGTFDHWVVFNIPPNTKMVAEGKEPPGVLGVGSSDELGYVGPCPPGEEHRYVFTLYSLDRMLNLKEGVGKDAVLEAMVGNILQKTHLTVYYAR